MNVLDLFSGIGGFSLGLERAGMRTIAFCEIDPYCQAVLRKHWPDVPVFDDVRYLGCDQIRADVICGGFPCQDISVAGKGAGIEGSRSGLWSEYARIIGEVRPRYVIVENVAALLGRGIERVLGDLAALGYDAEWHCIPASAVGAPHRRDRVWIIADTNGAGFQGGRFAGTNGEDEANQQARLRPCIACELLSNAASAGRNGARAERPAAKNGSRSFREPSRSDWWLTEPDVGRVAHGVPFRVDRLRALGNAIVPQIAEIIGKAIMEYDNWQSNGLLAKQSQDKN